MNTPQRPTSPFHLVSFAKQLRDTLQDDEDASTKDLQECGTAVLAIIRETSTLIVQLLNPTQEISLKQIEACRYRLRTLFALANDNINSTDFNLVNPKWLRLYTDVSILQSTLDLEGLYMTGNQPRQFWLAAVRRLDMAMIVAGGIGSRRCDWIASLIREIQQVGLPRLSPSQDEDAERPLKAARHKETAPDQTLSMFASTPVVEFSRAPSISQYLKSYSSKPFIVRQFFDSLDSPNPPWPAIHRWRSAEYLLDTVGEGRVVPVEVGSAYVDSDWGQKIIPFRKFLVHAGFHTVIDQADSTEDGLEPDQSLYLAQHSLFRQFPELDKDFSLPDYVWTNPDVKDPKVDYKPLTPTEDPITNVWIGSCAKGIVSPAHKDPHFNCFAQVLGSKRVWLAPPAVEPHIYAYGSNSEDSDSLAEGYMTNTSRVPIFRSDLDSSVAKSSFPLFFEHVHPLAQEAVLEPGDLLVMPPGWWHAMRGEGQGPGWSVSIWY